MSTSDDPSFISFPPGLLSETPLRIPVIGNTADWIAVNKPAEIAIRQHPWNTVSTHMDAALNKQLQAKKPELVKLDADLFGSVYSIEPEISGVGLFAKNRNAVAELRNLFGSSSLSFRFLFVARVNTDSAADTPDADSGTLTADAPLLPHNTKPKMIPSTAKGKKSATRFRKLAQSAFGWALWEATTTFPRIHQVRCHAAVHEIPILGDRLYRGPDSPALGDVLRSKRSPTRSSGRSTALRRLLFSGIALHLHEVRLPVTTSENELATEPDSPPDTLCLTAEPPKHFRLMLKHLELKL